MHIMTYKVYYYEESDRAEYGYFRGLTEKFKLIRAKSVDDAIKKFKEKYPSLFPVDAY